MNNTISWLSLTKMWLAVNGAGERRTFHTPQAAQAWITPVDEVKNHHMFNTLKFLEEQAVTSESEIKADRLINIAHALKQGERIVVAYIGDLIGPTVRVLLDEHGNEIGTCTLENPE